MADSISVIVVGVAGIDVAVGVDVAGTGDAPVICTSTVTSRVTSTVTCFSTSTVTSRVTSTGTVTSRVTSTVTTSSFVAQAMPAMTAMRPARIAQPVDFESLVRARFCCITGFGAESSSAVNHGGTSMTRIALTAVARVRKTRGDVRNASGTPLVASRSDGGVDQADRVTNRP